MVLDNITAGKWGDQSSKLNNNFNKTNAEIISLQGIANGGGKLFAAVGDLTTAYPNPVKGMYAYISSTLSFPAEIYSYNGTTWIDTGHTGNGGDAAENVSAVVDGKIVQSVGSDLSLIMSQKAVSDSLLNKVDVLAGKNLLRSYENGKGIYAGGGISDFNSEWVNHYVVSN